MWQKNSFRAFLTFKTIGKSQFWFWTTGWKSNHWYGIIPVNVKTTKKNPLKSAVVFCVVATTETKTRQVLIAHYRRLSEKRYWNICSMLVKFMYFNLVFFINIKFSPLLTKYINLVFTLNFCPSHACFIPGLVFTQSLKKDTAG